MRDRKHMTRFGVVLAMVVVASIAFLATTAFGETVLDYDANRTENPIADNITRLSVNKLERGSRDYVVGAHLCIIEKETGRLVTEWVSDGSPHEVARNTGDKSSLNIDTPYILRELQAPDGYAKAADTEFVLHSNEEFNTSGEIVAGPDAEFDVIRGRGDSQAFVINLYDEATVNIEEVEYRRRQVDADASSGTGNDVAGKPEVPGKDSRREMTIASLMQTGDAVAICASVAVVACLAAGIFLFRRRKRA